MTIAVNKTLYSVRLHVSATNAYPSSGLITRTQKKVLYFSFETSTFTTLDVRMYVYVYMYIECLKRIT